MRVRIKTAIIKKSTHTFLLLLLILSGCNKADETSFQKCNDLLNKCGGNPDSEFCTFGYKWGSNNPFSNAGPDINGPKTPGGTITFGFYEQDGVINTHSQTNLPTLSFHSITYCNPYVQIRNALKAWSNVADIEFQETSAVETANIRFAVAKIAQGGVGNPPFTDDLCSSLSGLIVISLPTRNTCDSFYNLALHEIGHALGLGHVSTDNIMNPNADQSRTELQSGDILGIQSIYGKK